MAHNCVQCLESCDCGKSETKCRMCLLCNEDLDTHGYEMDEALKHDLDYQLEIGNITEDDL